MTAPDRDRIAVLIPYHNEGVLLTRCLSSLARQTRQVDEVLVYDDASTTHPDAFVPPDVRVRVLRGDRNIGPGRARNRLFAECTASIVHFQDADDEFHPDWCRRVMEAARDADLIITESVRISEAGERQEKIGLQVVSDDSELIRFCLRGAIQPACATYRREVFEAVGGYRECLWQSEDWDLHIRMSVTRPPYRIIDDPLVIVYGRTESRSEKRLEVWSSALQSVEFLSTELAAEHRQDLADAAARIGSQLYRLGAREPAARAFDLADRIGPPRYLHLHALSRAVARLGGGECAEQAGSVYRSLVPERVRGALGRQLRNFSF